MIIKYKTCSVTISVPCFNGFPFANVPCFIISSPVTIPCLSSFSHMFVPLISTLSLRYIPFRSVPFRVLGTTLRICIQTYFLSIYPTCLPTVSTCTYLIYLSGSCCANSTEPVNAEGFTVYNYFIPFCATVKTITPWFCG